MKKSRPPFTEAPATSPAENHLSPEHRAELNLLLNQRLASAVDLKLQMKQAHWNVKGHRVAGLHEILGKADETVEAFVDRIAERIVERGGIAEGTVRVAAARTRLPEYPVELAEGLPQVAALVRALAIFGEEVRTTVDAASAVGDDETAALFLEVARGTYNWLWFVEAQARAARQT